MRSKAILLAAALFALVTTLQSAPARAAPCVGFTDVDTTSSFCKNVEWMKNRGITLGCGAGTTFCPNDSVTRLSMAAFMNRMGNVLVPVYINNVCDEEFSASPTLICTLDEVPAVGYPRTFVMDGSVVAQGVAADSAAMNLEIEESQDGGLTWDYLDFGRLFPVPGNRAIHSSAFTLPAGHTLQVRATAHTNKFTTVQLEVNTRIRFDNGISGVPPY